MSQITHPAVSIHQRAGASRAVLALFAALALCAAIAAGIALTNGGAQSPASRIAPVSRTEWPNEAGTGQAVASATSHGRQLSPATPAGRAEWPNEIGTAAATARGRVQASRPVGAQIDHRGLH